MNNKTLGLVLIFVLVSLSVTAYILLPDQIVSTFGSKTNTVQTSPKLSAIGISAGVGILGAVVFMSNQNVKPSERYKPLVLYSISLMIIVALMVINL